MGPVTGEIVDDIHDPINGKPNIIIGYTHALVYIKYQARSDGVPRAS